MRNKIALIIESDSLVRNVLSIIMEEDGFRVFECEDMAAAEEYVIKFHPDIIAHRDNSPALQTLLLICQNVAGKNPKLVIIGQQNEIHPDLHAIQRTFKEAI